MFRFVLIISLPLVAILSQNTCQAAKNLDGLLDAIRLVETGGEPNNGDGAIGDEGKALGPYQIWRVYWTDAVQHDKTIKGTYEDCGKSEYSRKVVKAYLRRYGKSFIENKEWENLARIHNGGPKGHKKSATLKYWEKVKRLFK
jgi:hypothetical protein